MSGNDFNMGFDSSDEDDSFQNHYSFVYRNIGEKRGVEYNQSFEDAVTWPEVLQAFVNFLNGVYGYDVSNKVRIEASPFGIDSGWSGSFYAKGSPSAEFNFSEDEEDGLNLFDDDQDEDFTS